METTEHYGTIRLEHIEDAVRKPTHEGAANISVYLRVGLRDVGLRLQREPNGHSLLVRRDRMEDQGSAEVGSSE